MTILDLKTEIQQIQSSYLAISMDTTGSMSPCIADVRQKLKDLAGDMVKDIPDLKIGIISHGDYCDREDCIKILDFTSDLEEIMDFLHNSPNTSGGDADECYELALNKAQTLSWPESGGSMVMIGDCDPHPVGYQFENFVNQLDWQQELKALLAKNVKVFPIQCMNSPSTFWGAIAEISNTTLLRMTNLSDTAFNLGAVAYASTGDVAALAAYSNKALRHGASDTFTSNVDSLKDYMKE